MAGNRVTLTRAEAAAIVREGVQAAKDGRDHLACPYSPAGDANERLRTAAWMRGFIRAGGAATGRA